MKKIAIILIGIVSISTASIIDLGKTGHTYPIQEENFYDQIKEAAKKLNITKEGLEKKIKESVLEQSKGTTDLPFGTKVKRYSEKNYQILPEDIVNPLGRVYKHKGDKVLLTTPKPLDLCFVDGKNMKMLINQITYFDKVVKKQSGKNARCTYMVSNRSVLDLNRLYSPRLFYPSKKAYEERFMVKSIPTYIHIYKEMKDFYSFPMSMFKHEVKTKWKKY